MFHTPPIDASFKDESTTESYTDPLRSNSISLQKPEQVLIDDDDELPQELPSQLDELIDGFLKDLRAPKYNKPLTPEQLCSTFQNFYEHFHSKTDLFVKGSVYYRKRITRIELQTSGEIEEEKKFKRKIEVKIRRYIEIAEEKICVELFDRLFNKFPKDVKTNSYVKEKLRVIKKIKGIQFNTLLDIKDIQLSQPVINEISHKFKELNHFKTPYSKLKVLISIHSSINQFVKTQISNEFADGDYFLPLLIYLILINQDDVDFYSNFIYIKRFRQDSLLVEESLYCLTNFEAAITFIQHLELFDNEEFNYSELSKDDLNFLKIKHKMETDESVDIVIPSDRHILSNSTDGIKLISSAIDSSFKSMMHRFGSSSSTIPQVTNTNATSTTAPKGTHGVTDIEEEGQTSSSSLVDGYNPINKLVGVMKWRSSTPTPNSNESSTQVRSRSNTANRSRSSTLSTTTTGVPPVGLPPVDIHKFKERKFKDLKMGELEELFNDYCVLTRWFDK